jgi:hypothetical protein
MVLSAIGCTYEEERTDPRDGVEDFSSFFLIGSLVEEREGQQSRVDVHQWAFNDGWFGYAVSATDPVTCGPVGSSETTFETELKEEEESLIETTINSPNYAVNAVSIDRANEHLEMHAPCFTAAPLLTLTYGQTGSPLPFIWGEVGEPTAEYLAMEEFIQSKYDELGVSSSGFERPTFPR